MEGFLNQLSAVLASHFVAAVSTLVALIGTSLLPIFREQVREVVNWALAPLKQAFPWDQPTGQHHKIMQPTAVVADFSLAEVFIQDVGGVVASYRKLSSYRAIKECVRYREGVSADGTATDFSTMRGTIVQTRSEHGFFVSEIDLETKVHRGARITNIYQAKLIDCFTMDEEQWTQEIAFPTRQLTLQIHFPAARPPTFVRCFILEGTSGREIVGGASIIELFGKKGIVWELQQPRFGGIYKVTWHW
jgi:hypothetical protein